MMLTLHRNNQKINSYVVHSISGELRVGGSPIYHIHYLEYNVMIFYIKFCNTNEFVEKGYS